MMLVVILLLMSACGSNENSETPNNYMEVTEDNNQYEYQSIEMRNQIESDVGDSETELEQTNAFLSDYQEGEDNKWQRSMFVKSRGGWWYDNYQSNWKYFEKNGNLVKRDIHWHGKEKEEFISSDYNIGPVVGDYIYNRCDYNSSDSTYDAIKRIRTDGSNEEIINTPDLMDYLVVEDNIFYIRKCRESATSFSQTICCVSISKNELIYESEISYGQEENILLLGIYSDKLYVLIGDSVYYINIVNISGDFIFLTNIENSSAQFG